MKTLNIKGILASEIVKNGWYNKVDARTNKGRAIIAEFGNKELYYDWAFTVIEKFRKRMWRDYEQACYEESFVDKMKALKRSFGAQNGSYAKKYFMGRDEVVFASPIYGYKDYNKSYEKISCFATPPL